jgi:crotonobetaine/carnitine-CoA ligase
VAPDLPGLADRTLVSAFERARADKPDAVAQIDRSGEWTYAEAYERPLRIAGGLAALGVGPDARVAALLDNSFDAIHNMFGRGLTGRIQVPINTAYEGRFSG